MKGITMDKRYKISQDVYDWNQGSIHRSSGVVGNWEYSQHEYHVWIDGQREKTFSAMKDVRRLIRQIIKQEAI